MKVASLALMRRWQSAPIIRQHARYYMSTSSRSIIISNGTPNGFGSGIGSDSSMISANHRQTGYYSHVAPRENKFPTHRQFFSTTTPKQQASPAPTTTAPADAALMQDEYGEMTNDEGGETFCVPEFELENGVILHNAELRYQQYGVPLNESRDNVIVICHALTGNASLDMWWGDLLGPKKAFDTDRYNIICCNILGSCYGSTSPQSMNGNGNGRPYSLDFPDISVQDTVRLQLLLLQQHLQINSIKAVIGGSFGGMQAVEFAVQGGIRGGDFVCQQQSKNDHDKGSPPFVKSVIPIACGAAHSAWQIAVSEVQRQAIYADPNWPDHPEQATSGLAVARQMGMVSYRTAEGYQAKFGRALQQQNQKDDGKVQQQPPYGSSTIFQAQSYLQYQGIKFLSRFDPVTYVKLTEQMDSHDIARGRGDSLEQVLARVDIPALVMGIDSDVLYPIAEQEFLAKHLRKGTLKVISSPDGHDGFLLEQEQVGRNITAFLDELEEDDDDDDDDA